MAYIIVGLGNPGGEYAKTRHNAGRMVVEYIAKKAKESEFDEFVLRKAAKATVASGTIDGEKVELVLPEVYMNDSGKVMPSFVKSVKAAQKLLVIRDDLDLPLGVIKMTFGRGSGGHKGVESIMKTLKTKDFAQLKIGISGETPKGKLKKPSAGDKVIKHVIGNFSPKEEPELKKMLKKSAEVSALFVTEVIEKATMVANTN
jgi:PTH1 family peptidyl-tRNA hydrolase